MMKISVEETDNIRLMEHPHLCYCTQQQQQHHQCSASGPEQVPHTTASCHTPCHWLHVQPSSVANQSSISSDESLFATLSSKHASCQNCTGDYILNDDLRRITSLSHHGITSCSDCQHSNVNNELDNCNWSCTDELLQHTSNCTCIGVELDIRMPNEQINEECATGCLSNTQKCGHCNSSGYVHTSNTVFLGAQATCFSDNSNRSFMKSPQVNDDKLRTVQDLQTSSVHTRSDNSKEEQVCLSRTQDLYCNRAKECSKQNNHVLSLCARNNVSTLAKHKDSLISNSQTVAFNENHVDINLGRGDVLCQHNMNYKSKSSPGGAPPQPTRRLSCHTRTRLQGMPKNLLQVLQWIALIFSVEAVAVQGQGMGPRYRTSRRLCVSDDECNGAIGEVCWWAWDGCDTGECMCDPRVSFHDSSMHFCRPLKFGNERCESGDKCWEGMSCVGGFCKCKRGTMTSDRMFCQENFQRFLGQTCSLFSDICYQRAVHGYTRKETHCSIDGVCRCKNGYKTDGKACRKWKVNEPGCSEDHHCEGGALCIDDICQCPSTYMSVAANSKCAKVGARYDLHLGEICNEIDEKGYCASGLICHRCPSETLHKCVRFVEAEALPYHFAAGNRKTFNAIYILLAALTAVLYMCTFCFR